MSNINTKLWVSYKLGELQRNLTEEELMEVDTCDLTMNLLLPRKSFENIYNELKSENWTKNQIINIIAMAFKVPTYVVKVRIYELESSMVNDISKSL